MRPEDLTAETQRSRRGTQRRGGEAETAEDTQRRGGEAETAEDTQRRGGSSQQQRFAVAFRCALKPGTTWKLVLLTVAEPKVRIATALNEQALRGVLLHLIAVRQRCR